MQRTICDRCRRAIEGPVSIVGLWGPGGSGDRTLPVMNGLPAVCVLNLCPECRRQVEDVTLKNP